jgi:hypothetical protein
MHHAFGTALVFVAVAFAITAATLVRDRLVARRNSAAVLQDL